MSQIARRESQNTDRAPVVAHNSFIVTTSESTPPAHARGVWLSLITVACWSVLPITLRLASRHVDPYTVTWYRFIVSAALLGAFLAVRRSLPAISAVMHSRGIGLVV